jgi:hypothetical protein
MRKDFPLEKIVLTHDNSLKNFEKKMLEINYEYYKPVEPTSWELFLIPKFKKFVPKRLRDVPDYQYMKDVINKE